MASDTVAAQKKARAFINFDLNDVGLNKSFRAQRPVNNVSARVCGSLLLSDHTGTQRLIDLAVVFGQANQTLLIKAVNPTVAHVSDNRPIAFDGEEGDCGCHTLEFGTAFGIFEYFLIAEIDRPGYQIAKVVGVILSENPGKNVNDCLAGDLSATPPANAVSNQEQSALWHGKQIVFVYLSFGIKPSVCDLSGCNNHSGQWLVVSG
jgi:hypothetical protein